jgi:hypothetical protein
MSVESQQASGARHLSIAALCAWIGVALFAVPGVWALAAPHSFYRTIAMYPPYNRHFCHDLGAFQLGIAAALLAGIAGRRGLAVGLWGAAVAASAHAVSHWMDHGLGGRDTDALLTTLVALVLVVGLIVEEVRRR